MLKWFLFKSREDVLKIIHFFNTNTNRSYKSHRLFLVHDYYFIYDLKAFDIESI